MKVLYLLSLQCLFVAFTETTARADFNSELLEEWEQWKSQHGKSYGHQTEELERHVTWASNRKYIQEHNANADIFGYTLAMNHFGDLVGLVYYAYFKPELCAHLRGRKILCRLG